MLELIGISPFALYGQLLLGLINGAFYAMLSLGIAIIFGMLRIANFVHGAQYMVGAFLAWFLLSLPKLFPELGLPSIGYWPALIIVPLVTAMIGCITEKLFIKRIYNLDPAYGVLLTLGLALVIEGVFHLRFGSSGQSYEVPELLQGGTNLGFMFLPKYRIWAIVASIVICFGTWLVIERSKMGSYLRAATENPDLVRAFGVNVPRMLTLTYGFGVGLAGLAGLMAAPIYQVSPTMGQHVIITIFAIVVIGGMGSIFGAIVSGFALGIIEGLTKVFYPEASTTVIFIVMAIVLLVRPNGLFGMPIASHGALPAAPTLTTAGKKKNIELALVIGLAGIGLIAPQFLYPVFLMKVLCYALFACAYNLIFGYLGLAAFGHAAFFGSAVYVTAHTAKFWGITPEIAILLGTAVATLLGLIIGWLAIRRQGLYFAMITLALSQIVYFYVVQSSWTHGEDGIQAVPRGSLFGLIPLDDDRNLYFFVLAVFLAGFALIHRIVLSPFGQVLKSIRENEPRAISLGYDTQKFKLLAFTLSAGLSGVAGGLMAIIFQIAILNNVFFTTSADVLLMVLIGGIGTVLGPVVGAVALVSMQNYFAGLGAWVLIAQGIVFILCVLTLRKGLVGNAIEWIAPYWQRQTAFKGPFQRERDKPPKAVRSQPADGTVATNPVTSRSS